MEQYKSQNAAIEKDLPTLGEIVGSTWKKEEKLKQFKSELLVIEWKIQLELVTTEITAQVVENSTEWKQDTTTIVPMRKENEQFIKDHIITSLKLSPYVFFHKRYIKISFCSYKL
jgi:hypothetical protein